MTRKLTFIVLALLLCGATGFAQARKGLKINEVMVVNTDNLVDDYGRHSAWIELFNSNFAPMEISSVFLTTDPDVPEMYPVPLGDVNTKIPKRQHVVFFADGKPTDGTFHTNFVLKEGQDNWIGIYDADGLTLIDSITVPASLPANASFARKIDGVGTGLDAWEVRVGEGDLYITPSSNNKIKDTNNKVDKFREIDANGFGMTITAMGIVFGALLMLSICFYIISRIGATRFKIRKLVSQGIDPSEVHPDDHPEGDSGEEIAAIIMALHEHLNAHDQESAVLTINKVRKAYSPWNSHIYSMRQLPRK
ncbi:MAG: OadG family protein [Muribaculaceae bacterium]|nr:OadG family protein [Muribaculaceae bacterium]MDE7142126.1 OadG family protein [Muribaculaceae bacterium]